MHIYKNPILESLSGMERLKKIGTYLWIGSNDSLESLEGLYGLKHVGQYVALGGARLGTCPTGDDVSKKLVEACESL